jgi:hypothetical protein
MVNQAAPWECVRLAAAFLTSTLLVQYSGIRSENGCVQLFSALPPRPLRLCVIFFLASLCLYFCTSAFMCSSTLMCILWMM